MDYNFQALKDPKYSIVYANLCKVMSTVKVEVLTEEGKAIIVTFRRMLLTRIQQEFESKESDEEKRSMLNAIKEAHDVSYFGYDLHSFVTTHITVCIITIACQKEAN